MYSLIFVVQMNVLDWNLIFKSSFKFTNQRSPLKPLNLRAPHHHHHYRHRHRHHHYHHYHRVLQVLEVLEGKCGKLVLWAFPLKACWRIKVAEEEIGCIEGVPAIRCRVFVCKHVCLCAFLCVRVCMHVCLYAFLCMRVYIQVWPLFSKF